jgi:hypothetical protein
VTAPKALAALNEMKAAREQYAPHQQRFIDLMSKGERAEAMQLFADRIDGLHVGELGEEGLFLRMHCLFDVDRDALLGGQLRDSTYQRKVALKIFTLEARVTASVVVLRELIEASDFAREKTASKWREGHDTDGQLTSNIKNAVVLDIAGPQ